MKKILILVMALVLATSSLAAAAVLDFEDLYPGYETYYVPIASPYHGFTMSQHAGYFTKNRSPNTGYMYGTTGTGTMFTGSENSIDISGPVFSVQQLDATSAWNTGQDAYFEGWLGGSQLFNLHVFGLTYTGPTVVTLNFTGIDKLIIIPGSLGTDAGLGGSGHHLVIDNLVYNAAPLPSTLLFLGTGLLALAGRRLRS